MEYNSYHTGMCALGYLIRPRVKKAAAGNSTLFDQEKQKGHLLRRKNTAYWAGDCDILRLSARMCKGVWMWARPICAQWSHFQPSPFLVRWLRPVQSSAAWSWTYCMAYVPSSFSSCKAVTFCAACRSTVLQVCFCLMTCMSLMKWLRLEKLCSDCTVLWGWGWGVNSPIYSASPLFFPDIFLTVTRGNSHLLSSCPLRSHWVFLRPSLWVLSR